MEVPTQPDEIVAQKRGDDQEIHLEDMELASLVDSTPSNDNESKNKHSSPIRTDTYFESKNLTDHEGVPHKKLNWLNGVAMPTCENMWGVIIFLRFFYIVGQSGIYESLLVVSITLIAALLTTVALSAIATSGPGLMNGGPYFMISRSLGPYIGAAIGLVYYLGITLLCILEVLGAVETFHEASGASFTWSTQVYSIVLTLLITAAVFWGSKVLGKLGVFFFGIVCATLILFYLGLALAPFNAHPDGLTGLSTENLEENQQPDYDSGISFSVSLAIFFPTFAAIFSGADRSKKLGNPSTDIPKGTFAAVIASGVMYFSFMILWGGVAHREYLKGNFEHFDDEGRRLAGSVPNAGQIVKDISIWPPIILELGIIIACVSLSIQCMIVAPVILWEVAVDDLIPKLRCFQVKHKGEPFRALMLTSIICLLVGLAGNLDAVAPLLTMCFLIMWAMVNWASFVMCILNPPSWRPYKGRRLRWRLLYIICGLWGAMLSLALMFIVLWYVALIILLVCIILYIYIVYQKTKAAWGSGFQGIKFQFAMSMLCDLQKEKEYQLNWRPQILSIFKISETAQYTPGQLLNVVQYLRKGKGLSMVTGIIEGQANNVELLTQAPAYKNELTNIIKQSENIQAFPNIVISDNLSDCLSYLLLSSGLGGLRPNTVVIGLPEMPDINEMAQFSRMIKIITTLEKAIVVVKDIQNFPKSDSPQNGTIDIWWIIHDGGLLMLFTYILHLHKVWRNCYLRVFVISETLDENNMIKEKIESWFHSQRMNVFVEVLEVDDQAIGMYNYNYTIRLEERRQKLVRALSSKSFVPDLIENPSETFSESGKKPTKHRKHESWDKLFKGESHQLEQKQRLKNCRKLNRILQERSAQSDLVLVSLPEPAVVDSEEDCQEYFSYLEEISRNLDRLIFIHGSGTEVIDY